MIKKVLTIIFTSVFLSSCNQQERNSLQFSTWGSIDEIGILKPILEDFTKETGIEVELIHIPDNYFQKLHMMFASESSPDVIFMNNLTMPVYADSGVFEDLGPWIANERAADFSLDQFYNQAVRAMSWEGNIYGIPRDVSNLLIYYNKTMFDKYSISYPDKNWTFADFLTISKQLTKDTDNDGTTDTFGYVLDKRMLFWTPFVWSNGGDVFNDELSEFTLSSPDSLEGLQFYLDLRLKHHVAPTEKETGNSSAAQLFSQEKVGMQLSGRWSVPTYRNSLNFEWDVIPFPKGKNGSVVDVDASGWCMSKTSTQKEKAWKLIQHLAGAESIGTFAKDGLIVPSRKDIANSEIFLGGGKPEHSEYFLEIIDTGRPTKTTPNWNEINTVITQGLESVWTGDKELSPALNDIKKRIDALLIQ